MATLSDRNHDPQSASQRMRGFGPACTVPMGLLDLGVARRQADPEACEPVVLLFLSRGFLNAFW